MAAHKLRLTTQKLLKNYNYNNSSSFIQKYFYCTTKSENEELSEKKKFRVIEFFEKQVDLLQEKPPPELEPETFVSLLKKSTFIEMGNPVGKVVIGEIYHVVGNDLYIDFGWKFPTVCQAPRNSKECYIPGAKVKLLIKDLELCTKFLGSDDCITLNEADCVLLGLEKPKPLQGPQKVSMKVNKEATPTPSEAVAKTIEAAPTPIKAAPTPSEAVAEPIEAAPTPSEATPTPSETTSKPSEAVAEPIKAAPTPSEAVAEPIEAAPKPSEATSQPSEGAPKPSEATSQPSEGAPKPSEAVAEPIKAAPTPSEATSKPTEAAPKPSEATPKPPTD